MQLGGTIVERCMLIVNPTAGRERAKYFKDDFKKQLERMFGYVELRETQKAGDATAWACEACEQGFDAVFCMGGDGTLNETINGLAHGNTPIRFGFVPLGTVNDLARALQIPLHPEQAISMLQHSKIAKVDIGKVNDRYFVNTVAAGVLPDAVGHVSIEQKTRLGPLAYFLTGLKTLQSNKEFLFKIESDNGTIIRRSPLIAAMLTNSIGSFRNIAPQARVNDGKIWLAVFKNLTPIDFLKVTPELLAGSPISSEYIFLETIEHAKITLIDGDLASNVDGDEGPSFPLELTVLPSFLSVYVPA